MIQLETLSNGWRIRLEDATVGQVRLDWQLGIIVLDADGASVEFALSAPLGVCLDGRRWSELVDPEDNDSRLGTLALALRAAPVRECVVRDGTLRFEFGVQCAIEVAPTQDGEAWDVTHRDFKLTCMPGGEIAIWGG